jgi:hypothetical protein
MPVPRQIGLPRADRPPLPAELREGQHMGSVIKKRRKRMSKKKHRKLLRKTRVQRRKLKK